MSDLKIDLDAAGGVDLDRLERSLGLRECCFRRRQVDFCNPHNRGNDRRFLLRRRVLQLCLQTRALTLKSLDHRKRMRRGVPFILADRRESNDHLELGRQRKMF